MNALSKSAALAVDHQMTTGMAWRPVINMVIIKSKVTDGVAWRPVSHGVSLKGVFDCLVSAKIAKKFFWGSNLVVWVNETIKTILSPFIFFTKKFHAHKRHKKLKKHKKHQTQTSAFFPQKNAAFVFCLFIFVLLVCFCFVSLFLLVVFCLLIFVLLACFCL